LGGILGAVTRKAEAASLSGRRPRRAGAVPGPTRLLLPPLALTPRQLDIAAREAEEAARAFNMLVSGPPPPPRGQPARACQARPCARGGGQGVHALLGPACLAGGGSHHAGRGCWRRSPPQPTTPPPQNPQNPQEEENLDLAAANAELQRQLAEAQARAEAARAEAAAAEAEAEAVRRRLQEEARRAREQQEEAAAAAAARQEQQRRSSSGGEPLEESARRVLGRAAEAQRKSDVWQVGARRACEGVTWQGPPGAPRTACRRRLADESCR
jgi:murein DD-endopeptidase MepM/ murein hydrolase activator NlpD